MILWLFPLMAGSGICAAFYIKFRLSGDRLGYSHILFCVIFNGFFVIPYMDVLERDKFPFWGHQPAVLAENPYLGWIALVSIFIHLFAFPVKRKITWWFSW